MTAISSNIDIKAKVEIDGIKSYQQILPVNITSTFQIGETVVGGNSGATAEVLNLVTVGTSKEMIITQRDGEFDFNEPIGGSISGLGETIAARISGDQNYNNVALGIEDGLWVIESTSSLGVIFSDAIKKINISEGGNYGTGYSFGFTLKNFELVKDIVEDGVFLQNLPVRYYLDFNDGGGYEQVWGGVLDTFPVAGSVTAEFSCVDSMKLRSNKIGSRNVPICLNRNYNCKVPIVNKIVTEINFKSTTKYATMEYKNYNQRLTTGNSSVIEPVVAERNTGIFFLDTNSPWIDALKNNKGVSLEVVSGGGIGRYNILDYDFGLSEVGRCSITFDKSLDDIVDFQDRLSGELSVFKMVIYEKKCNISQNDCLEVHNTDGSFRKGLKAIDNGLEFDLHNPLNYTNTQKTLTVTGLNEKDEINSFNSITYTPNVFTSIINPIYGLLEDFLDVNATIGISYSNIVSITKNLGEESYCIPLKIRLNDCITGTLEQSGISVVSNSFKMIGFYNPIHVEDEQFIESAIIEENETLFSYEFDQSGNDLIVTPVFTGRELLVKNFTEDDLFSSVNFILALRIRRLSGSGFQIERGTFAFDGLDFRTYEEINVKNLSIGTNGENVQTGNEYEGYPETLKYIDTELNGVDPLDINDASYTQAEEDYALFQSVFDRNPAHQINEQRDFNDILRNMLYFSHLGLFPDRFDKRTLSNWLPKSTIFSDQQPGKAYNKFISIGDIRRSRNVKIISDFELRFNYNEATGEYLNVIRIKNTDRSTFDFHECTEGLPPQLENEAFQAWDQCASGEKRIKKQSKTVVESEWIKALFPDGIGVGEAITFIRNQAAHSNHEKEEIQIVIPLSKADSIKDLLEFDSVTHPTKTDGDERFGWLNYHSISFANGTITLNYHLDINKKDPFIRRIGIIQDKDQISDIIVDNDLETNIIQDGAGY